MAQEKYYNFNYENCHVYGLKNSSLLHRLVIIMCSTWVITDSKVSFVEVYCQIHDWKFGFGGFGNCKT